MRRHNFTMQYQWLFICSNKRYEWHLVFTETICNFYHYFHAFTPPAKYWMQHKHEWEVANEKGHCDNQFSSVQSLSCFRFFVTSWTAACQASLSISNSQSLLKLISIESMMPSNHLILCFPLLLLPSTFPCLRVFSSELAAHIRWLKYWSFSFSISASSENSGLISFRIDWFDLLAVQGTVRILKYYSSKASVLLCSAFFMVQLSHPYMTTGKTIALTI